LEPLFVQGDEDQLRRLTLNLLHNAIKYTPEGGHVRISLRACNGENSTPATDAVIEVSDTGIGIDADHLPRIFDRFFRVDKSRSRAQGGSGLGLAICRWIVEAHAGRINVESRSGVGSTFTVRLPAVVDSTAEISDLQMAEA
jgi:signal transduction histidine kinase